MFTTKSIQTSGTGCFDITGEIKAFVEESGLPTGLCTVNLCATGAALGLTSVWDPAGIDDIMAEYARCVPPRVTYKRQDAPTTVAAQVQAALTGTSMSFLVQNGRLILGHSQWLVVMEFTCAQTREFEILLTPSDYVLSVEPFPSVAAGMHDMTSAVQRAVAQSGVQSGICHLTQVAATAGLALCPRDEAVQRDIWDSLERMMPTRANFLHRETAADAVGHIKTCVAGSQLSLIIENGQLLLGEDEAIVYAEFDGPRPRSLHIAVCADS